MLRALHVRNLALIEEVELQFEPGFTCLTGETGAGKSILLDALGLLLGARASSDMVREGADRAFVEGLFDLSDHPPEVAELLEENGVLLTDGQLIVNREVASTGKTIARLNGRLATVQLLRDVGQRMVHQHGQHDSVGLLRKEEHLSVLDAYAGIELREALAEYESLYTLRKQLAAELTELEQTARERVQREDILEFQTREIREARLRPGEEDELRERKGRMRYAERLQAAVDDVYEKVYEGNSRVPAIAGELDRLAQGVSHVEKHDPKLIELREYLETALVNLTEAADFVRRYRETLDFDPMELATLEERLVTLERIFRKYGDSSAQVLSHLKDIEEEKARLSHRDDLVAATKSHLAEVGATLEKAADGLSGIRRRAAERFEQTAAEELRALGMSQTRLTVRFLPGVESFGPKGRDDVEWMFSANQGEALRPLAKIASGGELSRVMLAIVQILADTEYVSTLVFDEIDTGISGRAAHAVADRMRALGKKRQVFCVTHLPLTASMATDHVLIEKRVKEGRTVTVARRLTPIERVEELAKMLGGERVTQATRDHARELLARTGLPTG